MAFLLTVFAGVCLLSACCKDDDPPDKPTGQVSFTFRHLIDGEPLIQNQLIYTNAAGNDYLVTELRYFISDITFYNHDGSRKMISEWKDIFYIDQDLPETMKLVFYDKIPAGTYDSITFVFGITGEKNQSFMFVNPPEVNMFWPSVLGGGYHYLMLNGKWKDPDSLLQPFDFHLGIGQLYHGEGYDTDSIYAFVQNWFTVSLPGSGFALQEGETKEIVIAMNMESWFETPHVYDHNEWGGYIMQNQQAMQMARENGFDVFSVVHDDNR